MIGTMISGDPKYKKGDMGCEASFVSKHKGLRLVLIEPEEERIGETVRRKRNTGCTVKFEEGQLLVDNKKVLELVLKHANFQTPRFGFDCDWQHPFWRAQTNLVEEKVTVQYKQEAGSTVDFDKLKFKIEPAEDTKEKKDKKEKAA